MDAIQTKPNARNNGGLPPASPSARHLAIQAILTLDAAARQVDPPMGETLTMLLTAWDTILSAIPSAHLGRILARALRSHANPFPLTTGEVLGVWATDQEERLHGARPLAVLLQPDRTLPAPTPAQARIPDLIRHLHSRSDHWADATTPRQRFQWAAALCTAWPGETLVQLLERIGTVAAHLDPPTVIGVMRGLGIEPPAPEPVEGVEA